PRPAGHPPPAPSVAAPPFRPLRPLAAPALSLSRPGPPGGHGVPDLRPRALRDHAPRGRADLALALGRLEPGRPHRFGPGSVDRGPARPRRGGAGGGRASRAAGAPRAPAPAGARRRVA